MGMNFLEALETARRRSSLVNQPGVEKSQFDKLLRDNAIRRLSTRGVPATPTSPFLDEVVQNVDSVGSSYDQTSDPSGLQGDPSVVGPPEASKESLAALGLPTTAPTNLGESLLAGAKFGSSMLGKFAGPLLAAKVLYGHFADPSKGPSGTIGVPGLTSGMSTEGPNPGEPGAQSTDAFPGEEGGQSVDPGQPSAMEGFIGAPSGTSPTAGSGASAGSLTVLCTELYRQGKMPWYIYQGDSIYGRSMDEDTLAGYHLWAVPLAQKMAESPLLTAILRPLIMSWAKEMAYRVGNRTTGTVLGKILSWIGEPVCRMIGRSLLCRSIKPLPML